MGCYSYLWSYRHVDNQTHSSDQAVRNRSNVRVFSDWTTTFTACMQCDTAILKDNRKDSGRKPAYPAVLHILRIDIWYMVRTLWTYCSYIAVFCKVSQLLAVRHLVCWDNVMLSHCVCCVTPLITQHLTQAVQCIDSAEFVCVMDNMWWYHGSWFIMFI